MTDQDGAPVAVSPRLAALCTCAAGHVFSWPDGTRALVFNRPGRYGESGTWYVARAGEGETFDRADAATTNGSSSPVRRAQPGEVGFARFDTSTDDDLFKPFPFDSQLIVVPFGPDVPHSREAPVVSLGTFARSAGGHLLVPVFCDRVCSPSAGTAGQARLPHTDSSGKRLAGPLEPFSVAYVRATLRTGQTAATIRVRATDNRRHRSATRSVTFRRLHRRGFWCARGASCP